MDNFIEFDQKLLFELGLTKEESELIYLVHPNFKGMKISAAAELLGFSRQTAHNKLKDIRERFPMFDKTFSDGVKERQEFRKNIKSPRRFSDMSDISQENDTNCTDGDLFMGEEIVRIF